MKRYFHALMQYALPALFHTHIRTHCSLMFPAAAVWMACFVLSTLTVSGGLGRRMLKLKAQQALWSGWLLCCTMCWSWRRGQHKCKRQTLKSSVCQSYAPPQVCCLAVTSSKMRTFWKQRDLSCFFLNSRSVYFQEQRFVADAACQSYNLLKRGFTPQAASLSAEVRVHVRTWI